MIPKRLQSRLKKIEATPLADRAQAKTFSRRDLSSISPDVEAGNEKYDTFFEYEDELADLKPSSEQYTEMMEAQPFVMLEELEKTISPITMEDLPLKSNLISKSNNNASSSFEFIQCEFIKSDKNRCKRQAPKNSTLCASHRNYLKNRSNDQ
jgi:hypothetical protein